MFLNIIEVRKAETNAQLVAENIATQLERRIAFRRAMKKATQTAMKFGAKGIKVASSGRLGGAEMCRREWYKRRPRAAAHAACRHRVRLHRGAHHLRQHRRQGVDLPRRGAAAPRRPAAPTPHALIWRTTMSMLSPKRSKFRKSHKGNLTRQRQGRQPRSRSATSASRSRQPGWITSRQIEAARVAISRSVKKLGKIYVRVFPDHPVTKKPAETRMGTGKGGVEGWIAVVRPGRVIFEVEGVPIEIAKEAFHRAHHKLSVKTQLDRPGVGAMSKRRHVTRAAARSARRRAAPGARRDRATSCSGSTSASTRTRSRRPRAACRSAARSRGS